MSDPTSPRRKRLSEVAFIMVRSKSGRPDRQDATQNIEGQTREVLGHIDRLLAEVGSDKTQILSCQIYLSDVKDFAGMNTVWDEWVAAGNAPPRATVEAKLARPELLVEIIIVAATKVRFHGFCRWNAR